MRLTDAKREAAAQSLARNPVQSAAAKDAHVDRASINKWLKDASFSARVAELQRDLAKGAPDEGDEASEASEAAQRGLASLVPLAVKVVEAALKGEPLEEGGKVPTAQQHAQALNTIKLARTLEPRATGFAGAPSLGDLILEADSRRAGAS